MKIKRIFTSNYKNLLNCSIEPNGIHALTGCNGSGKSNFLEVPEFVSSVIASSDEKKVYIFNGQFPTNGWWQPFVKAKEQVSPFIYELNAIIKVNDVEWDVEYHLEIEGPGFVAQYKHEGTGRITVEKVKIKESSKPGQKKTILSRTNNLTVISLENTRKKLIFKTLPDMSALQALEVREADDYANTFPVLSEFHKELISFNIIKINPDKLISDSLSRSSSSFQRAPGSTIDYFPMYTLLEEIQKKPVEWNRLLEWLKRLCNINNISIKEDTPDTGEDSKTVSTRKYIFIYQHDRVLFPEELSTGCAMLFGLLIAAHSFLPLSGSVILEEPESYLHPKAIIDLITLLREISEENAVIFSTHSPVALNSMQPSEVTVMKELSNGFVTTQRVSDINEAIDTLNRGYISFGDLLQTNFVTT